MIAREARKNVEPYNQIQSLNTTRRESRPALLDGDEKTNAVRPERVLPFDVLIGRKAERWSLRVLGSPQAAITAAPPARNRALARPSPSCSPTSSTPRGSASRSTPRRSGTCSTRYFEEMSAVVAAGTAAPWRSSSATRSWQCSVCRSSTRTTPCARRAAVEMRDTLAALNPSSKRAGASAGQPDRRQHRRGDRRRPPAGTSVRHRRGGQRRQAPRGGGGRRTRS